VGEIQGAGYLGVGVDRQVAFDKSDCQADNDSAGGDPISRPVLMMIRAMSSLVHLGKLLGPPALVSHLLAIPVALAGAAYAGFARGYVSVFWAKGMPMRAVRLPGVVVGSEPNPVLQVLAASAVDEVGKCVVIRIVVQVADFHPLREGADERLHDEAVDPVGLPAVAVAEGHVAVSPVHSGLKHPAWLGVLAATPCAQGAV
jgi:hypothetical protein